MHLGQATGCFLRKFQINCSFTKFFEFKFVTKFVIEMQDNNLWDRLWEPTDCNSIYHIWNYLNLCYYDRNIVRLLPLDAGKSLGENVTGPGRRSGGVVTGLVRGHVTGDETGGTERGQGREAKRGGEGGGDREVEDKGGP